MAKQKKDSMRDPFVSIKDYYIDPILKALKKGKPAELYLNMFISYGRASGNEVWGAHKIIRGKNGKPRVLGKVEERKSTGGAVLNISKSGKKKTPDAEQISKKIKMKHSGMEVTMPLFKGKLPEDPLRAKAALMHHINETMKFDLPGVMIIPGHVENNMSYMYHYVSEPRWIKITNEGLEIDLQHMKDKKLKERIKRTAFKFLKDPYWRLRLDKVGMSKPHAFIDAVSDAAQIVHTGKTDRLGICKPGREIITEMALEEINLGSKKMVGKYRDFIKSLHKNQPTIRKRRLDALNSKLREHTARKK